MDAVMLATKCKKMAESCSQISHIEVTRNFVDRVISRIESTADPTNGAAMIIIADALYKLEMENREGCLGNNFQRIN
jgi:hypothetical protein